MTSIMRGVETKDIAAQLVLLKIEASLASHAFELDRGRPATNWTDLVPTYLPSIPDDPATGASLTFPAVGSG
jgi:hypothetical protein